MSDVYDTMTVTVPEGTSGDVEVRRREINQVEARLSGLRSAFSYSGRGRATPEGTYTVLFRRGYRWMSDTPAEKRDHLEPVSRARHGNAQRVLVNGLGLGMVIAAMLEIDTVTHIDVVEIDADVIALVGEHYEKLAAEKGKTVTVHHGDAYTIKWARGTAWDVAWHDIWPDLCTDYLDDMAVLHRRYGRRVGWQGSWGKELLIRQKRFERRRGY